VSRFCSPGEDLLCPILEEPDNGIIVCSRSGLGIGDFCVVICDEGFELVGSATRECLANQTWSGTEATCVESPPGMHTYLLMKLIFNLLIIHDF